MPMAALFIGGVLPASLGSLIRKCAGYMNTKCKVKLNKLGDMMNDLLMKVTDKKEIYNDVFKLREKLDEICSLAKQDKSLSYKQGKYFMALAFKKNWKK
jgi:hypothetical protein